MFNAPLMQTCLTDQFDVCLFKLPYMWNI